MLIQTKRTINSLKLAGFSRDEFRVRTDRHYIGRHPDTGKQMFEYGKTRITLLTSKDKAMRLTTNILEQGFTMTYTLWEDSKGHIKIGFPRLEDDGRGRLLLWNTLQKDKNPLGEIYPIEDIKNI